jgi:hypothetical protein
LWESFNLLDDLRRAHGKILYRDSAGNNPRVHPDAAARLGRANRPGEPPLNKRLGRDASPHLIPTPANRSPESRFPIRNKSAYLPREKVSHPPSLRRDPRHGVGG